MADERTMSVVTMLNTAQRNRQSVNTVIAFAQVRGYYMKAIPRKTRKSAHPTLILKFFELDGVLRTIDDADVRVRSINYDDSDESDGDAAEEKSEGVVSNQVDYEKAGSATLPFVDDDDAEFDIGCDEVQEVLASTTVSALKKAKKVGELTAGMDGGDTVMDGDGDDAFELGSWL
ncbi:hypothetical protein HYPSUDRAFT_39320 [Hypholoma sublateritium FD-334 SS-4]|uniref:Uncharacterized protein n=1 Tax=Hypholoma sublateritium (strain FD-334 SS-4) TaxID=945553 RepID=A0A0D2P5A3_HYPSF|nr:hypothetical protein HYPSUDRAFT_39320 [Hypholoma sublateritium FD-334 SS-4]